jgi:hypothetical protein
LLLEFFFSFGILSPYGSQVLIFTEIMLLINYSQEVAEIKELRDQLAKHQAKIEQLENHV